MSAGRHLVCSAGFLTSARIRRILTLAGLPPRLGRPRARDAVMVWGHGRTAWRGEWLAARHGSPLVRVEDAFLRSLHPGRRGEAPLGLLIDRSGVHYDGAYPSDLETLLATAALDDPALLARARAAMDRLRTDHLTKYAAVDPDLPLPDPGFVLVVDQAQGDASVTCGGGDAAALTAMLDAALADTEARPVIVKTHPETAQGLRAGHFGRAGRDARVRVLDTPVSPWALLARAGAVYVHSSQLGFEAILAGHRPHVFGRPFYAGWGLSADRHALPRRGRQLSAEQLFAGAMLRYPVWYDPFRDRLCDLETAMDTLAAQARAWREDRHGWTVRGVRRWKRPRVRAMFGRHGRLRFSDRADPDRPTLAWGSDNTADARVEDGFLRSRGLGAALVPPLSLVLDREGIYYDPSRASALEGWIARRATLTPAQAARADRLIAMIREAGLSKYNLPGGQGAPLPDGAVLVVGQVEDDASLRLGAGDVTSNLALLRRARAARPGAYLVYKPHPDVEAGLRIGSVAARDLAGLADTVLPATDPAALLTEVAEVWTMTSLMGFEALLRGRRVVTLGAPFYAGWGLTEDLAPTPARRVARPALNGLVHAALIDYPRYFDPVTGQPCPVEVIVERLRTGSLPAPGPANRTLSKLQGLMATAQPFWR